MNLSNQDIKAIISKMLRENSNGFIEPVIRELIFIDLDKQIDWQKVWSDNFLRYNPEFKNKKYLEEYLKGIYNL